MGGFLGGRYIPLLHWVTGRYQATVWSYEHEMIRDDFSSFETVVYLTGGKQS